jgi:hypothetical protein
MVTVREVHGHVPDMKRAAASLLTRATKLDNDAKALARQLEQQLQAAADRPGGRLASLTDSHIAALSAETDPSKSGWALFTWARLQRALVSDPKSSKVAPASTPELQRFIGDAADTIDAQRRLCDMRLRRLEDDAYLLLAFRLDPDDRTYLLFRHAAANVDGIGDLQPDPTDITYAIDALPETALPFNPWVFARQGALVPAVCAVSVREDLLSVREDLEQARAAVAAAQATATALVETERHVSDLQRREAADQEEAERRRLDNERRDREGALATAGVGLIAPGLVASVYGANVLGGDASSLGMVLLMIVAVTVGFFAVRLISHADRKPTGREHALVVPVTYAAPFLIVASWSFRDLATWEVVAVDVGALTVLAIGVARLETQTRPAAPGSGTPRRR